MIPQLPAEVCSRQLHQDHSFPKPLKPASRLLQAAEGSFDCIICITCGSLGLWSSSSLCGSPSKGVINYSSQIDEGLGRGRNCQRWIATWDGSQLRLPQTQPRGAGDEPWVEQPWCLSHFHSSHTHNFCSLNATSDPSHMLSHFSGTLNSPTHMGVCTHVHMYTCAHRHIHTHTQHMHPYVHPSAHHPISDLGFSSPP